MQNLEYVDFTCRIFDAPKQTIRINSKKWRIHLNECATYPFDCLFYFFGGVSQQTSSGAGKRASRLWQRITLSQLASCFGFAPALPSVNPVAYPKLNMAFFSVYKLAVPTTTRKVMPATRNQRCCFSSLIVAAAASGIALISTGWVLAVLTVRNKCLALNNRQLRIGT